MTGEEICNLKIGDTIIVDTPYNKHKKGEVFKVEYIDDVRKEVFLRDVSKPLGSQMELAPIIFLFDNYIISSKLHDKVDHSSHYTWLKDLCGIEVIDIARHMDFDLGNSIKYILRSGHKKEEGYIDKQKTIEDLKKAIWYINDEINMLENNK